MQDQARSSPGQPCPCSPRAALPPSPSSPGGDGDEKGGKLCLPMAWAGRDREDMTKK